MWEMLSLQDSVLNLMDDIRELSKAYPMTDSNNNELDQYVKVDKVIGISDLEDISDGNLLDVDAESDEVNRSEFKDVSEGVLKQDTNGNEFVMVEDGISLDYNDDGGISDDSVINDEMSDCDNVDNDVDGNSDDKVISVERSDGKNTDNNDGEMSDGSVNSDKISDGENMDNDFGEIGDDSVNSDGEHVDNDDGGISDDNVNYYGTKEGENVDNDNVVVTVIMTVLILMELVMVILWIMVVEIVVLMMRMIVLVIIPVSL